MSGDGDGGGGSGKPPEPKRVAAAIDAAVARVEREGQIELVDVDGAHEPEALIDAPIEYSPDPATGPALELEAFARPAPANLELDLPPPPPAPAPAFPWRRVVTLVILVPALVVAGVLAVRALQPPSKNVHVRVVNVPVGAHLTLDGAPIEGRDLVLDRSAESHVLGVTELHGQHRGDHLVRFVADGDRTIDVSRAP